MLKQENMLKDSNQANMMQKFLKYWESINFYLFFNILELKEDSFVFSFALTLINFIQMIDFSFRPQMNGIWQSKFFSSTESFFQFFNVIYYLKLFKWETYIAFIIVVGLIIISFLSCTFLYALLNEKSTRQRASWVVQPMRLISHLITTILFIPFLEVLLSIYKCETDSLGNTVHFIYRERQCWQSSHLVLCIIVFFFVVGFLIITSVIALIFFDNSISKFDINCKLNGKLNLEMQILELVLVISNLFINARFINSIIIFTAGLIIFLKCKNHCPYLHRNYSHSWIILSTINCWTGIMLLLSFILENTIVIGSIYIWIFMIPFMILIQLSDDYYLTKDLEGDLNNFRRPMDVIKHAIAFLRLVHEDISEKNKILYGYIHHHNMSCNKPMCPLKRLKFREALIAKQTGMMNDKRLTLFYEVMFRLLLSNLTVVFPTEVEARVLFLTYVMDQMNLKEESLTVLNKLRDMKLNFSQRFFVFKNNKRLEKKMEQSISSNINTIEHLEWENEFRIFKLNLEKTATLMTNFWTLLQDTIIDFNKLSQLGLLIHGNYNKCETSWLKLQKYNGGSSLVFSIYARFKDSIFDDKNSRENILLKMRKLDEIKRNKGMRGFDEMNPLITIWVSMDKLGQIAEINLPAAQSFGYLKEEVYAETRKINFLMPNIFSEKHDSFLTNFNNKSDIQKNIFATQRLIFGKHKNNYIFPFFLNIKIFQERTLESVKVLGTFNIDKPTKSTAFMLIDKEGYIVELTASCLILFKISWDNVSGKRVNISEYFPDLIDHREEYMGKNGKEIEYVSEDPYVGRLTFNCKIEELKVFKGTTLLCYVYKFDMLGQACDLFDSDVKHGKTEKGTGFQMFFDISKSRYVGNLVRLEDKNLNDISAISSNGIMKSELGNIDFDTSFRNTEKDGPVKEIDNTVNENLVDYAAGIKTMLLIENRIIDPKEIRQDEEDDEKSHDSNESSGKKRIEENYSNDVVQEKVNQGHEINKAKMIINFILYVILILMILVFILSTMDHTSRSTIVDDLNSNFLSFSNTRKRISEVENIVANIRELDLYSEGIYTDGSQSLDILINSLSNSLASLEDIQKFFFYHGELMQDSQNDHSIPLISMNYLDGSKKNSTIHQGSQMFYSAAYEVLSLDIEAIDMDNSIVYFVIQNGFNSFLQACIDSSKNYFNRLVLITSYKDKDSETAVVIVATLISFIVMLIISFWILGLVRRPKNELLKIFLQVPNEKILRYQSKCEKFLTYIGNEENESELNSSIDMNREDIQNEDDEHLIKKKRNARKAKFSRELLIIIVKILLFFILVFLYFYFIIYRFSNFMNRVGGMVQEFNCTTYFHPMAYLFDNSQRNMILGNQIKILGIDSEVFVSNNKNIINDIFGEILQQHVIHESSHDLDYMNNFENTYLIDACLVDTVETNFTLKTMCNTLFKGEFKKGLSNSITSLIENMVMMNNFYQTVNMNESAMLEEFNGALKNFSKDTKLNKFLNMFQSPTAQESKKSLEYIFNKIFDYLTKNLLSQLKTQSDSLITTGIIILVFFNLLLLFVFFIVYIPWITSLKEEFVKTIELIGIMPHTITQDILRKN